MKSPAPGGAEGANGGPGFDAELLFAACEFDGRSFNDYDGEAHSRGPPGRSPWSYFSLGIAIARGVPAVVE